MMYIYKLFELNIDRNFIIVVQNAQHYYNIVVTNYYILNV